MEEEGNIAEIDSRIHVVVVIATLTFAISGGKEFLQPEEVSSCRLAVGVSFGYFQGSHPLIVSFGSLSIG